MGRFLPAIEHLDKATALYNPEGNMPLMSQHGGGDARIRRLSYQALVLWHLGYPDQALKRGNEALALGQRLSHPFSVSFAGLLFGIVRQFRREARAALQHADSMMALSTEYGFTDQLAFTTNLRGWAIAEQGSPDEGILQVLQGLAASRARGAELWRPHVLCTLAYVYGKTGRIDDGLSALTEALNVADEQESRHCEAEINRLRGELLIRRDPSDTPQAQSCYERAIEIARRQSGRSFELRATTSLARLLRDTGRRDEGRRMLADIYGWFTEGFDTADLKDAKALLDELEGTKK
jgi:predicted ATPase